MICKSFLIAAITTSICALFCACSIESPEEQAKKMSGNPIFDGWYADPEVALFDGVYWVFPTSSKEFKDQISFDAFSSEDLVVWKKHPNIIDNSKVKWLRKALWAPAIVEKDGKYYLFFSGNNPLSPIYKGWKPEYAKEDQYGGIGVAVSNSPEGPYEDLIGKPLISDFRNNAQPIDQYVFKYEGSYYMIYGGWDRCCLVKLADDFKSVVPFPDGSTFKNITPENYKEGSVMFERKGKLDAVVFSGGEPLVQDALLDAIKEVKAMGYKVGLHSGGFRPDLFKQVLPLVDWVGFDIKTPLSAERYNSAVGQKHFAQVMESLHALISSGIKFECRTTCDPRLLSVDDIHTIGKELSALGVKDYYLQKYRPVAEDTTTTDSECESFFSDTDLLSELRQTFPTFDIRK